MECRIVNEFCYCVLQQRMMPGARTRGFEEGTLVCAGNGFWVGNCYFGS